ncbi:hypothetical protein [Actinoalloteichus sp. GBA129-24]|uniref:hypothetical protein n=1 Tax=Actinoalloteichus sp. GBA129-24 TaxID=1612551 RepID=UPI0009509A78|nr:hypothetical protein [Actinoalloteichus sp. GBA129-24]APU20924.1 hypothetical protein UA75_14570 [Actinoalloteichus sp. GBA129-24]APU24173.1 hypothetical protein UA75_31050 [Actinoalloteichus sp. GBA129-24]
MADFPMRPQNVAVHPVPDEQRSRARLAVAAAATDAADCRVLLDCLGLLPDTAERRAS